MKADVTISKYNGKEIISCHLSWNALRNGLENSVPNDGWLIQYTVRVKSRKLVFLCFLKVKKRKPLWNKFIICQVVNLGFQSNIFAGAALQILNSTQTLYFIVLDFTYMSYSII